MAPHSPSQLLCLSGGLFLARSVRFLDFLAAGSCETAAVSASAAAGLALVSLLLWGKGRVNYGLTKKKEGLKSIWFYEN